jgi:hypothetical protein
MGFDYFKERRSLFAVREGDRPMRRLDAMDLLEGVSEWAFGAFQKLPTLVRQN